MSTQQLTSLNHCLRVVQYNGGPIQGQYGVSSAFQVEPGSSTRATATRAGTTFDIVLQYTGPSTNSIRLDQFVVISPKFEEVTAMLKAGVVWVHDTQSPFVTGTSTTNTTSTPEQSATIQQNQLDITYSRYFADFHKTKVMPQYDSNNEKLPKVNQNYLPQPATIFDYETKGPLTIGAVNTGCTAITTGQYIHIKFTETFDDDYNIDFGHFYVIGEEVPNPTTTIQQKAPVLPATINEQYNNTITIPQRQWLLKNGIISTPSSKTTHNVILTPQNHTGFFENTASIFVSAKPIHQYLAYIEGEKDIKTLPEDEQELINHFLAFTTASDDFTTAWRKHFTSDLITANLQKETGTGMIKGKKETEVKKDNGAKQLDFPMEISFYTLDPTTPKSLRNVVLGHLGQLKLNNDGVDPRQSDVNDAAVTTADDVAKMDKDGLDLELPGGRLFTIMACSPAGPCQKFKFAPKSAKDNTHSGQSSVGVCQSFQSDIAKTSLVPKVMEFLQMMGQSKSILSPFFSRASILSTFLHDYYEQLEKQLKVTPVTTPPAPAPVTKKKGPVDNKKAPVTVKKNPMYTPEQISWFTQLLTPHILSQQSIEDAAKPLTHPVYHNTIISSYHGLNEKLKAMATKEGQQGPECFFVMPVDKTTDQHLEICANLFEFSSILNQFQKPDETNPSKFLYPLQLGVFDVLGNNVNDCLYSYNNFLNSARLFISIPVQNDPISTPQGTTTTTTNTTTTTTAKPAAGPVKKQAALDKVAPPVKKFTLPLNHMTPIIPAVQNKEVVALNNLYAVDIVFSKMIDPTMLEFAQEAGEDVPPPTIIELVGYIAKVQGFLRTSLQLGPDWCIVPLASDKSPFAQKFGNELGKLNGLLDDISYLRMLHSTLIPSIYSRFLIQQDKNTLEDAANIVAQIETGAGGIELDLDALKLVSVPKDSNEDKLFRALKGFTQRAELLLGRVSTPVGIAPIPFLNPEGPDAPITSFLPQKQINDWDDDETKKIPQLITLMGGIDSVRTHLGPFGQQNLEEKDCIDIKEKMFLLRQGTDGTMNLLNDRVRVIVELRDCLLQVIKFLELFPDLVVDLVKNFTSTTINKAVNTTYAFPEDKKVHELNTQAITTFFSLFQYLLLNTGLIYSLGQTTKNDVLIKVIEQVNNELTIKSPVVFPDADKMTPTFDYLGAFAPSAPKLTKSMLSKLCPTITTLPVVPSITLHEAVTVTADVFTKNIKKAIETQTKGKLDALAKVNSYVELEDGTQLERCLDGYVILTPQVQQSAAPQKMSFSRTAVNKAAVAASRDNINNKKFDNADDRIIVLWLTHILDGSYNYIDQLQSTLQSLVDKYQDDKATEPQSIVLARVDIDTYPEILDQFNLEDASALPALMFIQSQAERADLRTTAISPAELPELLQAGLMSMLESAELYGVGGLDDDEADINGVDMDDDDDGETPE